MNFDAWKANRELWWSAGLSSSTDSGKIGVRIQIQMSQELRDVLDKETDWDNIDPIKDVIDKAVFDAREQVWSAIQRAEMMLDPKTAERAEQIRLAFVKAFEEAGLGSIFMEQIPNEYERESHWALRSPWYLVTTRFGHFKVGWRKRVIVLDWARTLIKKSGQELLPDDDVTKGSSTETNACYIHCYGYAKLTQYLGQIVKTYP